MGIISVLLTFLLSAILYYQGMQDQFSHEVGHLTETMAQAYRNQMKHEVKSTWTACSRKITRKCTSYG